MAVAIRTPFFETSVKNYLWGDAVVDYAREVDALAVRLDVDCLFFAPYTELRRVAEVSRRLIVCAPYMDAAPPGRGIANVLPEALAAAGARGVLVNHSERPMSLAQVQATIARAHGLGMFAFACADSVEEAKALAMLGPDVLNPEPTHLIGTGVGSDLGFITATTEAIRSVDPRILVEQAAGITTGDQVYAAIMAGSDGAGAASGILTASDPSRVLTDMVEAVASARDELAARTGRG